MKFNFNQLSIHLLALITGIAAISSCNKEELTPMPIAAPVISGQTIASLINSDASFSILKAAIARATPNAGNVSLAALLADSTATYTFFAPTDAAFQASGIPSAAALAFFRPGQLDTLLRYHLVGGQRITSDTIQKRLPNLQLPSLFSLQAPSAALPPGFRMSLFPSGAGSSFWVNNVPLVGSAINASNGVVYKTAAIVMPPSTTIKGFLAANPAKFSIFLAAVARADSGVAVNRGIERIDSVLNYAPANLTVFAPNNDAFRALFPPGTPDAYIIAAINTPSVYTAQMVKGLIAYHILGARYFSNNFTATLSPYNTLLALPTTPPTIVPVLIANNGASFIVKDVRPTSSPAVVVSKDNHVINGVVNEINQVLQPQ